MKKKGVIYQIIGKNVFIKFQDDISIVLPKSFFSNNISVGTIIILQIKEDKILSFFNNFSFDKLKKSDESI